VKEKRREKKAKERGCKEEERKRDRKKRRSKRGKMRMNKRSEIRIRKLLMLSQQDKSSKTPATAIALLIALTLLVFILPVSLAKAPTWVLTETQAEFNEGRFKIRKFINSINQ